MHRFVVVGALLACGACATFGAGRAPRSLGRATFQEGGDDFTHETQRFAIELFDDGTLAFEGIECVPALGRQYKTLSKPRFERVAALFERDCAAITPSDTMCDHGDTIRLFCGKAERYERTCERVAPPRSAQQLLTTLIDAAELQEWVGPREHKCKAR